MRNSRQQNNFLIRLVAIAVLVVVVLLIIFTRGAQKPAPTPAPVVDLQVEKLQTQSTSDDVAAIEKDLTSTNLDQIDAELKEVEKDSQSLAN